MASKRLQILTVLKARLADIQTAAGYATDAGLHLSLGVRTLTEDDPVPALAMLPGDELNDDASKDLSLNRHSSRLPVRVFGLAIGDPADPLAAAEELLGDLERTLFRPTDRTLGGLVKDVRWVLSGVTDRPEGGRHVGCHVDLEVDYLKPYGGVA